MRPIIDILNKIKWDKRENPEDCTIGYFDRISKNIIEIPYTNIKRIEGTFLIVDRNNEETHIPLHRVRVVKKKGAIVWQRKPDKSP